MSLRYLFAVLLMALACTVTFRGVLKVLQHQPVEMAYALVWANTKDDYRTPTKGGRPPEGDFLAFKNNPYVLFATGAPVMYELK